MDIMQALFFGEMRHRPNEPHWPDRDRFVLSKGHAVPALYTVLAHAGYFSRDLLPTLRRLGSPLQGHPANFLMPGIEASTGSLGQGFSIAIGMALASKLDGDKFRVYSMIGDGESQEGQIWEAAMSAPKYELDNLCRHPRPQQGPDRRLRRRGHEPEPDRRQVAGVQLARGHLRRARLHVDPGGVRRGARDQGQADVHSGGDDERQRRVVHGRQDWLARRRADAGAAGGRRARAARRQGAFEQRRREGN